MLCSDITHVGNRESQKVTFSAGLGASYEASILGGNSKDVIFLGVNFCSTAFEDDGATNQLIDVEACYTLEIEHLNGLNEVLNVG